MIVLLPAGATAIARAIFLIAPTELAPIPKLAPRAPSAPPQAYPIAWRTCAPTLALQILNAPPQHLTVKTVRARRQNPAPQIPTAPAQFLIVAMVFARPQRLVLPILIVPQVTNPIAFLASAITCCIRHLLLSIPAVTEAYLRWQL